MKKVIFIGILFLSISSCKELEPQPCQQDTYLTTDELSWNPYKNKDTIVFISNTGYYDTAHVSITTTIDTVRELFGNCRYPYQTLTVYLSCFYWADILGIYVAHDIKYYDPNALTNVQINGILDSYNNIFGLPNIIGVSREMTPQNNVLINGNTYNNVYIITKDTTDMTPKSIWRMCYSKQEGFIEFDIFQGLSWYKI